MIFKILVVDDELTMRKGISNYMNWASIDCEVAGTACDGLEAITFLRNHPVDIVITDIKMPGADGLEVARFVHEQKLPARVIILTGYADFTYAQTAIRYRVNSFILKPTNKKELFAAVQEAQKQLIVSQKQDSAAREGLAFLKDQVLQELTDRPCTGALKEQLHSLGLSLNHYCVAAFRPQSEETELSALKQLIIEGKKNAYCYRYDHLIISVYFLSEENEESESEEIPERILENCGEISEIIRHFGSAEVRTGISGCHRTPEEFQQAVSEAIHALTQSFYSEQNLSRYQAGSADQVADLSAENSLDLYEIESSLNNLCFQDAQTIAGRIFSKFKSRFTNAQDAKNICSQIYYICSRVLVKRGTDPVSAQYLHSIRDASDIFALEHAVQSLMEVTRESCRGPSTASSQLTEQAEAYIAAHLSDALSLDAVAGALHISPSHLSRTFKKATGEALTEYINKARIEKAKELLCCTDRLTYEVAEAVGYHDAAYFSSIFKKYTGTSPSEYKGHKR